MTEIAETQIQRLISLVAWMSQRDSGKPVSWAAAARGLEISEKTLKGDLQVLFDLTGESYKPWLASLRVSLSEEGFTLGSRGAFRRPLRLAHDELVSLTIGLAGLRGGKAVAGRLSDGRPETLNPEKNSRVWAIGQSPDTELAGALDLLRAARDRRRKMLLVYCGAGREATHRTIHPYQLVQSGKVWYLIAWCEKARAMRHFRVERILALDQTDESFVPKADARRISRAADLIPKEAAPTPTVATVAFSPRIARWIREEHPGGLDEADGRYLVKFPVADPAWLVREVLQYGAEAEILAPEAMRELLRRSLG